MTDLPGILRASLGRSGKSQREAARLMGISNQYLNDILHGRRRLTPELAAVWSEKIEPSDKGAMWQSLSILGAEADGWDVEAIYDGIKAAREQEGIK